MSPAAMMKEPRVRKLTTLPVEQTAKTIGTRLHTLRKSQKVTLVELAEASGVDAATISRIETGRMTGTLECHLRLATALGVKITELYAGIEEARMRGAVTLQSPAGRADVYEAGKFSIAMLTTNILKKKLMPVLITIEPGGSTHKEEAKVGTEKFIHILEGSLEAKVGEVTHVLQRGSSLYLDASVPHRLKNVGHRTARYLSIVTPPVL